MSSYVYLGYKSESVHFHEYETSISIEASQIKLASPRQPLSLVLEKCVLMRLQEPIINISTDSSILVIICSSNIVRYKTTLVFETSRSEYLPISLLRCPNDFILLCFSRVSKVRVQVFLHTFFILFLHSFNIICTKGCSFVSNSIELTFINVHKWNKLFTS